MHVSRPPGLPALAIVLPHPSLPGSRSFASAASSPSTPRTPSRVPSIIFSNPNRNSTDSWNSSNAADELQSEWKPEQVRLLSRTLDALPAHLVTPFNGPIPPSNLLDKIARGVSEAKGPIDWPHSIRATRVKLIELSRLRAKEERAQHMITEVYSEDMDIDGDNNTTGYAPYPDSHGKSYGIKRPLYRQSSMDFMKNANLKENDNISCLADHLIPNPAYHPYARHTPRTFQRRLSSPARPGNIPSLINPSTPSSSTLNTLSSFSTHNHRVLHRSPSNLSSTSASSISMLSGNGSPLSDPRVQRVKRSDSFCGPAPPPKDIKTIPTFKESPSTAGVKRAPSFGALAQEVKRDRIHTLASPLKGQEEKDLPAYPSSDEEEKIRSKGAKKMRVKEVGGLDLPPCTPPPASETPTSPSTEPPKRTKVKQSAPRTDNKVKSASPKSSTPKSKAKGSVAKDTSMEAKDKVTAGEAPVKSSKRRPAAMNLQRNPSIFGPELPHIQKGASPLPLTESSRTHTPVSHSTGPVNAKSPINTNIATPPSSPHRVKTLRRVGRLAPARKISFTNLAVPGEDADGEEDDGDQMGTRWDRQRQRELGQLGSAFQLH